MEPDLKIQPESCICQNCRDSLSSGQKDPENYHPRWKRPNVTFCVKCQAVLNLHVRVPDYQTGKKLLTCTCVHNKHTSTHLCDMHYRSLHKALNPANYQWKCVVCLIGINGSNYSNFRACSEPELFQSHLNDFQGKLIQYDKVCMECYRYSLTISRIRKENPISVDDDFRALMEMFKKSLPPLPFNMKRN